MGWVLMILLCFGFGALSGLVIKNPLVAIVVGAGGGYLIGQLFQTAGLVS